MMQAIEPVKIMLAHRLATGSSQRMSAILGGQPIVMQALPPVWYHDTQ